MKSNFILLIIFFLLLQISCKDKGDKEIVDDKKINKTDNETETNEEEEDSEKGIMSDEVFEEKLKKVLEEKQIKKNKKITKDVLRQIFDIIYEKEFDLPSPSDDIKGDLDINPLEESKHFMEQIFNQATRSLDYDDKIPVQKIKDYISPSQIKIAANDIIENIIQELEESGLNNSDL